MSSNTPLPEGIHALRVLTIDGGPAALLHVHLLRRLEQRAPGFLRGADMLAGTSDGAFLTLFLASRLARGDTGLQALDRAACFMERVLGALHAGCFGLLRLASGLGPLDCASRLRAVLASPDGYGPMRLSDLGARPLLMIGSFDADAWESRFFGNFPPYNARPDQPGYDPTLVDVALSSSAFPLYLPIHAGDAGGRFLDGGLVSNNPAMCVLTSVLRYQHESHEGVRLNHLRDWLPSVRLLSLGAYECLEERAAVGGSLFVRLKRFMRRGATRYPLLRSDRDVPWGWIQWLALRPLFLVDVMSQGSVAEVSRQCEDLLDEDFLRFAPSIKEIDVALRATLESPSEVCAELAGQAAEIAATPEFQRVVDWLARNHWTDHDVAGDAPA